MSIKRFEAEFNEGIKISIEASEQVIKKSIAKLANDIIMSTPVDTGQLRANWNVSLGSPNTEAALGKTDRSGVATSNRIESNLEKFNVKRNSKIFLSNNLNYATRIEFGHHSQQAPAGMVRINIIKFAEHLRHQAEKNKK